MMKIEALIREILAEVDKALLCSDVQELDRCCYFLVQAIRHPDIDHARPLSRARLAEALAKLQQHRRDAYHAMGRAV